MLRIIAAGTRRAGSMFIYNTVRAAMADKDIEAAVEGRYTYRPGLECFAIKAHKFQEQLLFGANLIITSHRDPRDIAADAVRRGLVAPVTIAIIRFLIRAISDEYDNWRTFAQLDLRYEQFKQEPISWTKQILEILGRTNLDPEKILTQVLTTPVGSTGDAEIMVTPPKSQGDDPGAYKTILSKNQIAAIEAVFEDWMREHDYK